jgi:molybdopterin synthase catalytic subunit
MKKIAVLKQGYSLDELVDYLMKENNIKDAGCIVTFSGIVRGRSNNEKVLKLWVESKQDMCEQILKKIAEESKRKFGLIDVLIHHRIGMLDVSENIVQIVVCAAHRKEAFEGISEIIEQLKKQAPIWKKEIFEEGSRWVS